uniref:T9SS type A sorting domain-containing protein n=1 Tax=Flavobacterium sp. TaxID=239 RepID=UPI004048B707
MFVYCYARFGKKVEIFNVLGKKVLETVITSKEVNIGQLEAGIYIIKIKEGDASATRKLIVN